MSNSKAKEIADKQRLADTLHHESRLQWLSKDEPLYSCGTPVPSSERHRMIVQSKNVLSLIKEYGMVLNHAQQP